MLNVITDTTYDDIYSYITNSEQILDDINSIHRIKPILNESVKLLLKYTVESTEYVVIITDLTLTTFPKEVIRNKYPSKNFLFYISNIIMTPVNNLLLSLAKFSQYYNSNPDQDLLDRLNQYNEFVNSHQFQYILPNVGLKHYYIVTY